MKDICCVMGICIIVSLGCRSKNGENAPLGLSPQGQVDALLGAAKRNDGGRLRELIGAGVDIDQIADSWGTALHQAVFSGDLDAVRLLVTYGADVNKGDTDGCTPLHEAASSESEHAYEIVKILLAHGADVNTKIKSDDASDGSMHIAEGHTPLHNAVGVELIGDDLEIRPNKAVVELLLAHGAKANEKDGYGYTPLFGTVFPGFHDVMELLIEHGADVNVKNSEDGGTALHEATHYGFLDTVTWLVSHGADVHAGDFSGETPLHKAALGRYTDVVVFLVEHGADLHARSNRNETPQDFLDEPNDPEAIILPDSTEQVSSSIITDGLLTRRMLKSKSIDYDSLWLPAPLDINGLRPSLREWLEEKTPQAKNVYVDHDRILRHFDQYDREYAGFAENGRKYILCNMVQFMTDRAVRPPRSRFFGMFDGGCSWVIVVFEARTKQVVRVQCNNM